MSDNKYRMLLYTHKLGTGVVDSLSEDDLQTTLYEVYGNVQGEIIYQFACKYKGIKLTDDSGFISISKVKN